MGGIDGCFGGVVARIGDVGPSWSDGRVLGIWKLLDMRHGAGDNDAVMRSSGIRSPRPWNYDPCAARPAGKISYFEPPEHPESGSKGVAL